MALLKRHNLFLFTILIISFVACYSTLQDQDPLIISTYVDDSPSIDDGGTFNNLIKQNTDVLSLINKLDKLGSTSHSLEMVNVIDYGARGNGHDDTEVYTYSLSPLSLYVNNSFLFNLVLLRSNPHIVENRRQIIRLI